MMLFFPLNFGITALPKLRKKNNMEKNNRYNMMLPAFKTTPPPTPMKKKIMSFYLNSREI